MACRCPSVAGSRSSTGRTVQEARSSRTTTTASSGSAGRPIEPLQLLDTHGRVIYVGSFSKTMLPTLRLGFLVAQPSLRTALEAAKFLADWHSPLATQAAMARFLADGLFARHVRRVRSVYQDRHQLIVDHVTRSFADVLEVVPSSVGLHLAAFAPGATVDRIEAILRRASAAGVECQPLSMFAAGESPRAGVVLGYGAIDSEQIEEGLARLRACFQCGKVTGCVPDLSFPGVGCFVVFV